MLLEPEAPGHHQSGRRQQRPGYRGKAREVLAEAIAMYCQIGMPKHVEMMGEA
jgi:hypothetical protein